MFIFSDGEYASGWEERDHYARLVSLKDLPKSLANLLKVPGKYVTLRNGTEAAGVAKFLIQHSSHDFYPAKYVKSKGCTYICADFLEACTGRRVYHAQQPIRVSVKISYVEGL